MTDAARLRITLLDLDPAPWRLIEVPLSMSFKGLHDALQAAFGWHDSHLWAFDVDDRTYGPYVDAGFGGEPIYSAANARLAKLRDSGVTEFLYTYDMGDDWAHQVDVVDLFEAPSDVPLPRFLEGQWRAPPEDVGGPPGFEAFLDAIADPNHPDHKDLLDWHGGPFDPNDIGEELIHIRFKRLAKARRRKT